MIKICGKCGKEYPTEKRKSKYCSTKCSAASQSKKVIKSCEYCGSDYPVHKYRENTSKFCTNKCREEAQYKPGFDGDNKICTECRQLKPLTEFWKGRTKCKVCLKQKASNYYVENKEAILQKSKEYRGKNFDKLKAQKEEYKAANKENYRRYLRNWKKRNLDKVRIENRISCSLRRARYLSLPNNFTQKDWEKALEYFNFSCAYCGSNESLQQEHIVPLSAGGGTTKDNMIPACSICNNEKNNKPFKDWFFNSPHFTKERYKKIIEFVELNTEESLAGNGQESVESRGSLKL